MNIQTRHADLTAALCKTQSAFTSGGFQLCQFRAQQSLSTVTKHIPENSFLKRSLSGCSTASFQKLCLHSASSGCSIGTRVPGECQHRAQPRASPAQPAMDTLLRDTATLLPALFSLCAPVVSSAALLQWQPPLSSAPHPALGSTTHISQGWSTIQWHNISDYCLILIKWDIKC